MSLEENIFTLRTLPLIPKPLDLSLIEDIYQVGDSSTIRWRTFINAEKWDPKQFQDKLLQRRAYHARYVWETSLLLHATDLDWLCVLKLKNF